MGRYDVLLEQDKQPEAVSKPAEPSRREKTSAPAVTPHPVRPVLPVPPVRGMEPIKRVMKSRHPFDIYQDQYESLKELALQDRMQGEDGSMSAMVREALDVFIQKRRSK
jgi:hypothetical protein